MPKEIWVQNVCFSQDYPNYVHIVFFKHVGLRDKFYHTCVQKFQKNLIFPWTFPLKANVESFFKAILENL